MILYRQLGDVIDLEMLQSLQDNFSKAMGLAFVTVDYKGRPITRTSGFTTFCVKGRERPAFKEVCFQCDAHGGLHAAIEGEPYIYRCHSGLVDFAVPFILEGSYMGAVLGGQVLLPEEDKRHLENIVPHQTNWSHDSELCEEFAKIQHMDFDKLLASVTLLRDMIQNMLEENFNQLTNEALDEQNKALMEERAHRLELEESLQENELLALRNAVGYDSFFSLLNIISKLAYQEKSPKTEESIYDFSDLMRYAFSNSHIVTLGEELDYIERLLRIQKNQLDDRLQYEISVPEEYRNTVCPFMLLQPLVDNALRHAIEPRDAGGTLTIRGVPEDNELRLSIVDNGSGMSQEAIESALSSSAYREAQMNKMSLYLINRKLKGYFGPKYGLRIKSLQDGLQGTELQIRLPLRSRGIIF